MPDAIELQCPKCGCRNVSMEYDTMLNVLRCYCNRCDYYWQMAPLDATPAVVRKGTLVVQQ